MRLVLLLGLSMALGVGASGCASVLLGAGAGAGVLAAQERGFKAGVADTKRQAQLLAAFANEPGLLTNVGVMVWDGAVVLTGVVPTAAAKTRAVEIAKTIAGVTTVTDQLLVGHYSAKDYAADAWLTSKIRAELMTAEDVDSINYNLESVLGQVYVQGVARSAAERYRVLYLVRSVTGVLGVHPFIEVLPPPAAQQVVPQPVPAPAP